ncbi:MAG: Cna B-type domain-containing protein, partial [Eubacterium sp.]
MKNKNSACSVGKTLFTLFLSVAVILTFSFVSVSFADTGNTGGGTAAKAAKIGSTAYDTVQEAIDAAKDGDTVVLQSGASADQLKITKVFDKDITFKGTGTLTMDTYGWHFYHTLTLDGSGVKFNVTSDSNAFKGQEPGQRWLIMCLAGTINVKNGASLDFTFDSSDGANTAIYAQDNRSSAINVENKSSLSIQGKNTKGKTGQGIQVGGNSHLALSVKAYSHFLIDGTNRGYVDSPTIDVENSDFTVQNCSSNASNGGTFTAVNSTVNFLKNSGHGLSADKTVFTDSTLNSKENGYTGVDITGKFTAENSTFNVSKNGWHTWDTDLFAGMRLRSAASIDSASALNINNNYEVGLHVKPDSRTAIADGAQVSIIDNGLPDISSYQNDYYSWDLSSRAGKMAATNGDGIYNQGTLILPKGAAVYNNHAINAGDDIYSTGTITFEKVGSGWKLDGGENNKARNNGSGELTGKDCSDTINGWFDDTETTKENPENARWEAHKSGKNHIVAVAPGRYTSTVAVKAAHFGIIQGVKKWDDTSNQDGKRPDSINVSLYANSHKIATHAVSTKDADSSDSSSWKFAFAGEDFMDASQYADENGKLVFTVADDDNVYPYTETSIGTSDNNYTITNKYDPQHVCIPVWVSWDDNQNQDNVRPDSVTVHVKGTVPDKTDASKTTTVEDKSLTL